MTFAPATLTAGTQTVNVTWLLDGEEKDEVPYDGKEHEVTFETTDLPKGLELKVKSGSDAAKQTDEGEYKTEIEIVASNEENSLVDSYAIADGEDAFEWAITEAEATTILVSATAHITYGSDPSTELTAYYNGKTGGEDPEEVDLTKETNYINYEFVEADMTALAEALDMELYELQDKLAYSKLSSYTSTTDAGEVKNAVDVDVEDIADLIDEEGVTEFKIEGKIDETLTVDQYVLTDEDITWDPENTTSLQEATHFTYGGTNGPATIKGANNTTVKPEKYWADADESEEATLSISEQGEYPVYLTSTSLSAEDANNYVFADDEDTVKAMHTTWYVLDDLSVVDAVSDSAFKDCPNLKWVVIHKNIDGLGSNVFMNTPKLVKIKVLGRNYNEGSVMDAFVEAGKNKGESLSVKVPSGYVGLYTALFKGEGGLNEYAAVTAG